MIEDAGLPYAPPDIVPNTLPSLVLGELARDAGKLGFVHRRLFDSYWGEGCNIGDRGVLASIAADGGLDPTEALEAIDSGRYEQRILGSTQAAMEAGVNGVPAWVMDDTIVVPGAQPHPVFERALASIGHTPIDGEGAARP